MIWQQQSLTINTNGRAMYDISDKIQALISGNKKDANNGGITKGLCHIFIKHTSASLLINENADPTVQTDIEYFLSKWVKDGDENYRHNYEGDDDMAAHIRSLLTQTELTVPITNQRLCLGTWQGVYLYEHRYRAHERNVVVTWFGESSNPKV